MSNATALADTDWADVAAELRGRGWSRLTAALDPATCTALEDAATGPWSSLPEVEGAGVRQAGRTAHAPVASSAPAVRRLAAAIRTGFDATGSTPPLPEFNHVQWGRPDRGRMFITAHRDPVTAGGIVAIATLRGRAAFRAWEHDGPRSAVEQRPEVATEWETGPGDLVLLRGGDWPFDGARCPLHEADDPRAGERVTLQLRHNVGGYGAPYFGGPAPRPTR